MSNRMHVPWRRRAAIVAVVAIAVAGGAAATAGADEIHHRGLQGRDAEKGWPLARLVKRQWGVEVAWVRRLAAGQMLEFRYRVSDPEKAKELFVRHEKPHLVDEASGLRLRVASFATTGEIRNSNLPKAGQMYWMLFPNPGGAVAAGSRVTIEIGEFKAPGLVVR